MGHPVCNSFMQNTLNFSQQEGRRRGRAPNRGARLRAVPRRRLCHLVRLKWSLKVIVKVQLHY